MVGDFFVFEHRVERYRNGSRLEDTEVHDRKFSDIRDTECDAIARTHTEISKKISDLVGSVIDLSVREGTIPLDDRDSARESTGCICQHGS